MLSMPNNTAFPDGFVVTDSLDALRDYAAKDDVKVKMKPGTYLLDEASDHHFIRASQDRVINSEVRDCVAAGFNIGNGDVVENCRANARYAEALSCPYSRSQGARVDLAILDSRGGLANTILATINGEGHKVRLHTSNAAFVPAGFSIEMATRKGYAYYQKGGQAARDITLHNDTPARIVGP